MPWYPRLSDDVNPSSPDNVVPVDDQNPIIFFDAAPGCAGYESYPDHLRYGDTPHTRPARRGYIAYYLAPQIWQADLFGAGKIEYGSPTATTMVGGMAADSPQRRNLPNPAPTSYGDLVDLTTALSGAEPWTGW